MSVPIFSYTLGKQILHSREAKPKALRINLSEHFLYCFFVQRRRRHCCTCAHGFTDRFWKGKKEREKEMEGEGGCGYVFRVLEVQNRTSEVAVKYRVFGLESCMSNRRKSKKYTRF